MGKRTGQVRRFFGEAVSTGMAIAIPVVLLLFILYPTIKLAITSLLVDGSWSVEHYRELIFTDRNKVIWNTALVTGLSTLFATLLGLCMALVVVRGPWRGKGLINFTAVLHIISPPFVAAIVFIMLFGRRGFITNTLLGLDVTLIGWEAIVILQTLGNSSIAYLIIANVLRRIDTNLEKSALDLGASQARVFFTVTLPLMLPGITAAALLVFTNILADFGTPILVGGGFRVLASEAYIQVVSNYNMGYAAALCLLLLVPCLSIIFFERILLGNRLFYSTTLSVEKSKDRLHQMGPVLSVFLYAICLLIAALSLSKLGVIIIGAFTNIWGYDYTFTLSHVASVFGKGTATIANSLRFAFMVALLGPLLGVFAAYYVKKSKYFKRFLEFLCVLPYAVPGPVMGISFVMAFHHPPLVFTGTVFIIVMVSVIRELPISYNAGKAVLHQVSDNIEKAAEDLGSSRGESFIRVIFPLMTPAYKVGMIHAFIHAMTTIGAIIFLITPRNKVMTFEIFTSVNSGILGNGAAYSFLLIVLTLAGIGLLLSFWMLPGLFRRIDETIRKGLKNYGTKAVRHKKEL